MLVVSQREHSRTLEKLNKAIKRKDWETIVHCLPLLHWHTKMVTMNNLSKMYLEESLSKKPKKGLDYILDLCVAFESSLCEDGLLTGSWVNHNKD